MKKLSLTSVLLFLYLSSTAFATVDLTDKLIFKNYIQFNFMSVHARFLSPERRQLINRYLAHSSISKYANNFKIDLATYIREPKILNAITYLNFKWKNGNKKGLQIKQLVNLYYIEKRLALNEIADDPRYQKLTKIPGVGFVKISDSAKKWIKKLGNHVIYKKSLDNATNCILKLERMSPSKRSGRFQRCLKNNFPVLRAAQSHAKFPFAAIDLGKEIPTYPGIVISRSGFIKGNKVTTLNISRGIHDAGYLQTLEEYKKNIIKKYEKRWAGKSDQEMINQMVKIIKTSSQPIYDIFSNGKKVDAFDVDKNIIWQEYNDGKGRTKNQIFPQTLKAIRGAKSTIFFDIFFWGGTVAISLTNELISLLEQNPNLKLIFLHDHINHFGHRSEMAPVFNFMRAYMIVHPERVIAVPAHIFKNVSGLPPFISEQMDDKALRQLGFDERMSLYIKAKSDHSKAIIIDGDDLNGHPVALIGSKNLTDSSGPVCNDEVIMVEGPAAHILLDNYWKDAYNALKYDWQTNKPFQTHYEKIYSNGFATRYGSSKKRFEKIKLMLAPIDILKRYDFSSLPTTLSEIKKITARKVGNTIVRIGENSVGSFVTSTLNQNIHAIVNAKSQILINDQLIYDKKIVDILIKKKRESIDVKIILEGFVHEGSPFPGMPNLLYLDKMKNAGIEIKWKLHQHSDFFVAEHHGKTISIDGFNLDNRPIRNGNPALIIGSANKDIMTMVGAFRETQVEVFDSEAQLAHDSLFWENWNNEETGTTDATPEDFKNSPYGKQVMENMSFENFISQVRGMIETLYSIIKICE